ncbi:MAG: ATP-binding protein [bacterium]|nr:ATP-binding protein [bacterium]
MIKRNEYQNKIKKALSRAPVVALLGPRQCGKTTLAKEIESSHYFDLESPADQNRLINPEMALESLSGLIIIDEIQLKPELFNILRVLVDKKSVSCQYIILGSASPDIIKHASESLAGRIEFIDMSGFDLTEIDNSNTLWVRGGFPRSYLAKNNDNSVAWREDFIRTFLERDIPQLGINIPPVTMRRFWTMLAHSHGQTWNGSELGRSIGATDKTVRKYLDVLTGTFMTRQLQPWFENIKKRQVKSPKIYIRDSGIMHTLLGIENHRQLLSHPKLGASWEGFALEQVLNCLKIDQAYFWATHSDAELDLLFFSGSKRYGVEFKFSEAPKTSRSMRVAIDDLNLEKLWIVYPGEHAYAIDDKISVMPLSKLGELNSALRLSVLGGTEPDIENIPRRKSDL